MVIDRFIAFTPLVRSGIQAPSQLHINLFLLLPHHSFSPISLSCSFFSFFLTLSLPLPLVPATPQETAPQRVVGALVSVAGMLLFALLVALATERIASRVDQLQRASQPVRQCSHTVVVGA